MHQKYLELASRLAIKQQPGTLLWQGQLLPTKPWDHLDTRVIVAVIAPRDEARVANEVCEMTIVPTPAVYLASSFVTRSDDGHDLTRVYGLDGLVPG